MNKCIGCGRSLYLSDVEENIWHDDYEEFILTCHYCGQKNNIIIRLFDEAGHISKYNLEMLKTEKNYLPEKQLQTVSEHLKNCQSCSEALDNCILNEIETKVKFNEKTLTFFMNNSKEIFKEMNEVTFHNNGKGLCVEAFELSDNKYTLKEEDSFFRDSVRVCYYLRINHCLVGLVSFLNSDKVILERIWLRSSESIKKEQKFFQDLKDKKIKLELQTLATIFKRIR